MSLPWEILLILLCVMVTVLFVLVTGLLRQASIFHERLDSMVPAITSYELGQRIADFELPNAAGKLVRSTDLVHQNGAVLLWATTSCSACKMLLTQVEKVALSSTEPLKHALVVIVAGKPESFAQMLAGYPGLRHAQLEILTDADGTVLRQVGITAVPVGLAVDRKGQVTQQTQNPHVANWVFSQLGLTAPAEPAASGSVPVIVPAGMRR